MTQEQAPNMLLQSLDQLLAEERAEMLDALCTFRDPDNRWLAAMAMTQATPRPR